MDDCLALERVGVAYPAAAAAVIHYAEAIAFASLDWSNPESTAVPVDHDHTVHPVVVVVPEHRYHPIRETNQLQKQERPVRRCKKVVGRMEKVCKVMQRVDLNCTTALLDLDGRL